MKVKYEYKIKYTYFVYFTVVVQRACKKNKKYQIDVTTNVYDSVYSNNNDMIVIVIYHRLLRDWLL